MADVTGTYYSGQAIHGYGSEFLVGDGTSPENFEAVAEVIEITPPQTTTASIDKTHLRSPGAHREVTPGIRESSAFEVRCNYRPDHESHTYAGGGSGSFATGGIPYLAEQRTIKNFKIVVYPAGSPAGEEIAVTGFISAHQITAIGIDNKVEMVFSVQPTESFAASLP